MSVIINADFVGGAPTPVQPSQGRLMEIGGGEPHLNILSPRPAEPTSKASNGGMDAFQNARNQPPPPPPAEEQAQALDATNVAAEARKSIATQGGDEKAGNRGVAKPKSLGNETAINGLRGGAAYTERSGYRFGERETPANDLILGLSDNVPRDQLSHPDAATAVTNDPLARWIATGDSILAYLQPKKVFSVVSMGDKRRSKAISMVTHAQIALCDPGLYDVHSNSYVGIDENGGYMKEKCIPFHLLAVTCMLKGKKTGGTMLGKIEEVWEEIKAIATTDNGDFQLSNAFLETPLVNHAKKAYIKYHSIVFVSDTPHICAKRGGILLNWIMELKDDVRTNKERIEKERWGTILAEATNTATMAQAEPHSGGDEEPEVSFQK